MTAPTDEGPRDDALTCDGAEIGGNVDLSSATIRGTTRLDGAHVGGSVTVSYATAHRCADRAEPRCHGARAGAGAARRPPAGRVDLFRAATGTLDDDVADDSEHLGSWEEASPILEGFSYGRFSEWATWGLGERTRWLKGSARFEPAAWAQLIAVYRGAGRDDDARNASIARENDRLSRANLTRLQRAEKWVLRLTIGYGYRTWLAGLWAVAIIGAYAVVVSQASFVAEAKAPTKDPPALVYAADVFLPVIDFGQTGLWTPAGAVRPVHGS